MNRRQLFRNALFAGATLTAPAKALEFPENFDASRELAKPDWKPVFFNDHQNQTLIVISDLLIPATDTPGAKAALVNRFLDLLLSVETRETQQSFLNSLAFFDSEARTRYGDAYILIPVESQVELLHFVAYPNSLRTWGEGQTADQSGYQHFQNLKGWVSRIFYTSELGMKALGWDGEAPHGQLTGCEPNQKKVPARAV